LITAIIVWLILLTIAWMVLFCWVISGFARCLGVHREVRIVREDLLELAKLCAETDAGCGGKKCGDV